MGSFNLAKKETSVEIEYYVEFFDHISINDEPTFLPYPLYDGNVGIPLL